MVRLRSDGERFTTLSVSQPVAAAIHKRRDGASVDNFLRKLLGLPVKVTPLGRPVGTTGIPRRTAKKKKAPKRRK